MVMVPASREIASGERRSSGTVTQAERMLPVGMNSTIRATMKFDLTMSYSTITRYSTIAGKLRMRGRPGQ